MSELTLVDEAGAGGPLGRVAASDQVEDEEDDGDGRGDASQGEQGDAAAPLAVAAGVIVAVGDTRRAVEAAADGVQEDRGDGEADGPPLVQGSDGGSCGLGHVGLILVGLVGHGR